jgi:hypothetical protein
MSNTSAAKFKKPPSFAKFIKQRKPLLNINKELSEKLSALDRLAYWITNLVGTMSFSWLSLSGQSFGWDGICLHRKISNLIRRWVLYSGCSFLI